VNFSEVVKSFIVSRGSRSKLCYLVEKDEVKEDVVKDMVWAFYDGLYGLT
jgi:hypothetical protein